MELREEEFIDAAHRDPTADRVIELCRLGVSEEILNLGLRIAAMRGNIPIFRALVPTVSSRARGEAAVIAAQRSHYAIALSALGNGQSFANMLSANPEWPIPEEQCNIIVGILDRDPNLGANLKREIKRAFILGAANDYYRLG
jgi:hypothetical protein